MEESTYFEAPISTSLDKSEVVVEALLRVYEQTWQVQPQAMLSRETLVYRVQRITNYYEEDVAEVIDRLFDKQYLIEAGENKRAVFGSQGLWLLETACMNDDYTREPSEWAQIALTKAQFFN